uniref:BPTI/Kunitz inhibitor domain-containing protein n=1 Tax=Panagrellus redivivus TaxID=6233 RepID=A0A7E4VV50_PANRE
MPAASNSNSPIPINLIAILSSAGPSSNPGRSYIAGPATMRVPSRVSPHRCLHRLLFVVFAVFTVTVNAALPTEFEPFLEVLFETVECEPFLAEAKYISVSTSECRPYTCDFPRQMCMREAARHTDESANECISIPAACLTAANGGIPVGPGAAHIVTTPPPRVFGGVAPGGGNPADRINGNGRPPVKLVTGAPNVPAPPPPPDRFLPRLGPNQHGDICQQGVPEGRFCGFQLKFTYNKETGNCEQFWFPGCATDATNDNLFGGEQDCKIATSHCSAGPAPTTTTERPIRIRRPTTPAPPPPKRTTTTEAPLPDYPDSEEEIPQPPPAPERGGGGFGGRGGAGGVDLGSLAGSLMGGGGGGPGGIVGQFLGSGLGGGGGGGGASSRVVPSGYGGNSLGGGGGGAPGGGGGGANFIGLIANAVKQVSNKPAAGAAAGGAPAATQWLKNIDAGQITNLFSSFGR